MPRTELEMTARGLLPLTAVEIEQRLIGKTFVGLYSAPFVYVMRFDRDGGLWGRNNTGTEDKGQWVIDPGNGNLSVRWQNYWDTNTTRIYASGAACHLFDTATGLWRTSLLAELDATADMAAILTPPWFD